jgi:hypothetical protein
MACAEAQSRLVPRPSAQSKKESPGRAKEFGHALSAGSSHLLMTSLPCRPSTALRRRLPAARRCARMEATRAPTRGLTHAAGIGGRDLDGAAAAAARTQSPAVMATGAAPMDGRAVQDPGDPGESRQACAVRNAEGAGRSSGFLLAVPDRKQARCGPTSRALPSQCLLKRQSRAASSARWQWIIATRTTTTRRGAEDFTPPSAVQLRRGTPLRTVRPGGRGSPLPCSAVASAAASPRLFTATVQPRTGCSGSSVPVVEDVASERCALKAPRRSSRPGLWDIHLALFRTKQNIA